jgi:polysaccharide pyruvyl transferase WcaK-like protein
VGHKNVGDEALFLANKKLFNSYKLVPLNDKVSVSGITLFGGGTLLPMWTMSTARNNRYNYAFGVGVRNPIFWGKFDSVVIEQIKRFRFRFVGVRGNLSQKILKNWGIASEVIGDPVLMLEPQSYTKKEEKIAINVSSPPDGLWGNTQDLMNETIKLCKTLKKHHDLVLIPFYSDDVPLVEKIAQKTGVTVFGDWMNIQNTLDFLSSCNLLIGQKLHANIFSAATYTPFISLEYRPKCLDFAESVGYKKYNLRSDHATAKRVMGLLDDLLRHWDNMRDLLIANVKMYRKRIKIFASQIINDIEALPDDKWLPLDCVEKLKREMLSGLDIFCYYHTNNVFQIFNSLPITAPILHWKTRLLK